MDTNIAEGRYRGTLKMQTLCALLSVQENDSICVLLHLDGRGWWLPRQQIFADPQKYQVGDVKEQHNEEQPVSVTV